MDQNDIERASLVALLSGTEVMKPAQLRLSYEETQSFAEILDASPGGSVNAEALRQAALAQIDHWESDGTRLLTCADEDYPAQLLDVYDYPLVIFTRGKLPPQGQRDMGISIVGSRDAEPWAIESAKFMAGKLVSNGVTVVSGLAAGVDAAAQRTALDLGGRTVGIIGTGIRRQYPATNAPLQLEVERRGLVVSQFWPDEPPRQRNFPMRNGVMSAYSSATIVVQAGEKSGTRHQVAQAVKHGRPVILSKAVATTTSWGRKYGDDPLNTVFVAGNEDEALNLAFHAIHPPMPQVLQKA